MSRRVLLCDDEVHILRAAEFKLRRAGHDVRTAGDGEEAWETILAWQPEILITDQQMPRLDGTGLIRRVRAHAATAELPIIVLSARGLDVDQDELLGGLHVAAVMPKPFSPRELLDYVNKLLGEQCAC